MRFPSFSAEERLRRRELIQGVMEEHQVRHVLLYGAERAGSAVQWVTGWPVTREALVVLTPGERDVLLVQFFNHVPQARELASECDVRWGGPSTVATAADLLSARQGLPGRIGVIGALPWTGAERLRTAGAELVDLGRAYTRLRLVKSREEVEWLRTGAELSDLAVTALLEHARAGMDERELADVVERAYVPRGRTTHLLLPHLLRRTRLAEPARRLP